MPSWVITKLATNQGGSDEHLFCNTSDDKRVPQNASSKGDSNIYSYTAF